MSGLQKFNVRKIDNGWLVDLIFKKWFDNDPVGPGDYEDVAETRAFTKDLDLLIFLAQTLKVKVEDIHWHRQA